MGLFGHLVSAPLTSPSTYYATRSAIGPSVPPLGVLFELVWIVLTGVLSDTPVFEIDGRRSELGPSLTMQPFKTKATPHQTPVKTQAKRPEFAMLPMWEASPHGPLHRVSRLSLPRPCRTRTPQAEPSALRASPGNIDDNACELRSLGRNHHRRGVAVCTPVFSSNTGGSILSEQPK